MNNRPLYFTMWYQLLQELSADGPWQLLGVVSCAYQHQWARSTVVEDMLHQLEWDCLLEETNNGLSEAKTQSVLQKIVQEAELILVAVEGAVCESMEPLVNAYRKKIQQIRERVS